MLHVLKKCKQRRNKEPRWKHAAADWTVPPPARRMGSTSPRCVYEWEQSLKKEPSSKIHSPFAYSSPRMQMKCYRPPLVNHLRPSVKSLSARSSGICSEHRGIPLGGEKSHAQGLAQSSQRFPTDLHTSASIPSLSCASSELAGSFPLPLTQSL